MLLLIVLESNDECISHDEIEGEGEGEGVHYYLTWLRMTLVLGALAIRS